MGQKSLCAVCTLALFVGFRARDVCAPRVSCTLHATSEQHLQQHNWYQPELSAPLRTELLLALHSDALQAVASLLGAHDREQLADIVGHLHLQSFAPGTWAGWLDC